MHHSGYYLVSFIFGTTIPTSFNILVKCFLHFICRDGTDTTRPFFHTELPNAVFTSMYTHSTCVSVPAKTQHVNYTATFDILVHLVLLNLPPTKVTQVLSLHRRKLIYSMGGRNPRVLTLARSTTAALRRAIIALLLSSFYY